MELLVNYLRAKATWREKLDRELQAQIRLIKQRMEQQPKGSLNHIRFSERAVACERLRRFNAARQSHNQLERFASTCGVKLHNLLVKHPF